MNSFKWHKVFKYFLISIFSLGLIFSYSAASSIILTKSWAATDPYQITNDQVNDNYLLYIKQKTAKGLGELSGGCQRGLGIGILQGDNIICNPGLENLQNKVSELDDEIIGELSDKLDKKEDVLKHKFQKLGERLEKAISEEEEEKPIPKDEQKKVEEQDVKASEEHKTSKSDHCRDGNVLDGASNEEDLRVVAECQEAAGDVMHTKKMNDGDYKFLLKLDDNYEYLLNDKNVEKTDGLLVVEVVPKDQDIKSVDLPKEGDKVHIWGAWVTDKPKGWHEIHPTWEVAKQ